MRLVTWNIRKCIGLDRRRRPERTLEVLARLRPEVAVLQEADRRFGRRRSALPPGLITAVTGLVPLVLPGIGESIGWHGNAILIRPGLAVESVEALELPHLEPRGALLAELQDAAGEPIRVVGVHLGLTRRQRRRQLREIVARLAARPSMPTVILGDFNEWFPRRGLEPLRPHFTVHAPGRSFHAARPVAALDRIALCPRLTLAAAGIEQSPLAREASDHLPVWAEVTPTGQGPA